MSLRSDGDMNKGLSVQGMGELLGITGTATQQFGAAVCHFRCHGNPLK